MTARKESNAHIAATTNEHDRPSLKTHLQLAEASWGRTVKQRHELLKKDYPSGGAAAMPLFPCFASEGMAEYFYHPYTIWDLTPASFPAPFEMERVGRLGDGGKWTCGLASRYAQAERPIVVYSFGVGLESSWEEEVLSRVPAAEVWGYDDWADSWGEQLGEANRGRAHYIKAKIGTDLGIRELMKRNGHEYIDILKMDIECAEFEVLDALCASVGGTEELPVGQLLVEIHLWRPDHVFLGKGERGGVSAAEYLAW
ncbi:hypothetical protein N0V82_002386 [Gnomoniopsis sp. IMI 355080]|nr:hypothetical protein N0V82_002386 [Gnomoniopsis sp. IMI 355080]